MYKLKFRQSALTFETTSFIINQALNDIQGRHIIMDFGAITFINPYGMLFLKTILTILSEKNKIEILFENHDVINYLVRMSFHKHFSNNQNIIFKPMLDHIHLHRSDLSDRLIELTDYQIDNDDDVERITERITEIIAPKVPFYDDISDVFLTAISETLSNIEVHSTVNKASVCLQTYGHAIIMAIGDMGIGIKAGLKNLGEGLSDEDAIETALQPEVSSRIGRGGMGLTELSDKIKERNDSMGIRSRSGYLMIENGQLRKGKCAELSGTQLMIKLSKC